MRPYSVLTRRVFRSILTETPFRSSECAHRLTPLPRRRSRSQIPHRLQHRTIFGFSAKPQTKQLERARVTPQNVELALGKMVDLVRARRTQSRAPSEAELVDAFRFLFRARAQSSKAMTRNEIFLATETFEYLRDGQSVASGDEASSLTATDLEKVLVALASTGEQDKFRSDSRALATAVFDTLRQTGPLRSDGKPENGTEDAVVDAQLFEAYVRVLAATGSSSEALDLLRSSSNVLPAESLRLWVSALKGLRSEGRVPEFWQVLSEVQAELDGLDSVTHEELTVFLAGIDDVDNAARVFGTKINGDATPTTRCIESYLSLCIRKGQSDNSGRLGELVQAIEHTNELAGTVLLWHAAQRPGIDHVKRQINKLGDAGKADILTMHTFNRLVDHAYSQNDREAAEAYIRMAKEFGLLPNAVTCALKLDYEVRSGDLLASAKTFEQLSVEDLPDTRTDIPILNRYITALAFSQSVDYELLMRVVDRILESGADLHAESIAGLCWVFLQKDELEEATSLLRHRVDFYPMAERARIGAVFRQFILDSSIKDQRAFNAYELFRHAFPETSVEDRLPLVQSFFNRNRPDLGCLVFGHMRQREDLQARPTAEAYAQCFEGIARCKDVDGLQMVYNMLKLDREVEQTTRIRNALMQAYTACRLPFTAIIDQFWKILDSREGPTLSTFALALRACETWVPQGGQEARRVVALMQKWDLIITKEIYDCYIGALAGQSEFENTVELIEEMEQDIGEAPDAFTIGTFYNAIPWQYRKDEVEAWAKRAYPELWAELLTYGETIDEEWEIRYFQIDRSIDVEDELLFSEGRYNPQLTRPTQIAVQAPQG